MVKIDIISGFLGAGKTTFSNMLLRHYMNAGLCPVYIVNEFGETGLDAEIIQGEGFQAIEIDGGCICCTLQYDIATSIKEVIEAFSPTNIVFEPCGIFIFDNFFDILKQPGLYEKCEVQNVITIVDSVNFTFAKAAYGSFIYNQIKNAETILLSKLERTTQDVEELLCDVKNINPNAHIMSKIFTDWDAADFEFLLNQPKTLREEHRAHQHNNFKTLTVKLKQPFTQDKLDQFVSHCADGTFGDLVRVKGVVQTDTQSVLVNIAMQDAVLAEFKRMAEPSMTFVGKKIKKREIMRFLA